MMLAPLSFQQDELVGRMRSVRRYAPTVDLVHVFELDGPFDVPSLAAAIDDLVQRHPALRTTLHVAGDAVFQCVHSAANPVRIHTASAQGEVLATLSRERYTFDQVLSGQPLFRAAINVVAAGVLLSFAIHHLVHDGWSCLVLWRDLSELYAARCEGRPADLPPIALTYTDFAEEQRRTWSDVAGPALAYWRDAASAMGDRIRWPGADDMPAAPDVRATVHFGLEPAEVAAVCAAARSARVSPFLVLLAISGTAVARVTGHGDLLVGSNSANREDHRKANVVGYFTNTRLTHVRVDAEAPLRTVLRSVRERWLHADEHFREVDAAPLLEALGQPGLVKISMLDLPGLSGGAGWGRFAGAPVLPGVTVRRIAMPPGAVQWREFECTWIARAGGFGAEISYRPPANEAAATAIANQIVAAARALVV